MTDITKEELKAYTDSMTGTVLSLEKIASSLEDLVQSQTETKVKLETVSQTVRDNNIVLATVNTRGEKMATNVLWVKWLWTVLAGVVGLGMLILQIMHKTVGG